MMFEYLMHDENDTVGVVVEDVEKGRTIRERTLQGKHEGIPEIKALSDIPLGHKVALCDFEPGDTVLNTASISEE